MPIGIDYMPSAGGLGGMMYGAGRNMEQNERMQQLLQWLMQIRGQNLDRLSETERQGLQREMFDKGQLIDRERMGLQKDQFAKELSQRDKDSEANRRVQEMNSIRQWLAQQSAQRANRGDWRDGFGGSFMNYGRPRTFLGREW